jgi:ankyrin repeat protein
MSFNANILRLNLVRRGKSKNEPRHQHNEYEEDLYDDQPDVDEKDERGNTKLHYAYGMTTTKDEERFNAKSAQLETSVSFTSNFQE